MAKDFTPAPWNIERLLPNGSTGFNPYLITVNLIVGDYEIAYITESENGEADARLIAAAPDLYEALILMCNDCSYKSAYECRVCPTGQALRKARGEEE